MAMLSRMLLSVSWPMAQGAARTKPGLGFQGGGVGATIFCLSLAAGTAQASEPPALFLSSRAAGRGGTGVAAFESTEAARFNPAILAESKARVQIRPIALDGAIGENAISTISDLTKLSDVSDGLSFLRSFEDKFGERQYLRGQISPVAFRIGGFEFQSFGGAASWLELRQPSMIEATFEADSMIGGQMSYAHALGAQWGLGATFRYLSRTFITGDLVFTDVLEFAPPASVQFDDYAPLQTGQGYAGDLGLIWHPTPVLRFGLTFENVGDTTFTANSEEKGAPPPLLQSVNLGGVFRQKLGMWDLDYHADWRDVLQRYKQHLSRAFHLGLELGRPIFTKDHDLGVTGGIQEGYLTGGVFVDVWLFRIDLSNYAVELGEVAGQRMDRRWALSLQTSISF